MVYNTQNHWVPGFCPKSGILNTRKHKFRKLDPFPSSGEGRKKPTLMSRSVLELVSPSPHLKTETSNF
jgi:hypothetical protein